MSLWKKRGSTGEFMDKKGASPPEPCVEQVTPQAAIPGGEIGIRGRDLVSNGHTRPTVRFGELAGSVLLSSSSRLVVRVPEGAVSGDVTIETGGAAAPRVAITVGHTLTESLHPVANPAIDMAGNIYSTFSGGRGQKVPVSVFKVDGDHDCQPFLNDLMNPTGLAFDREGLLYVSSRMEGTIYRVTPDGQRSVYAEGMGIATGLAFDGTGNLYVGDRTGTIFKINKERQIFVFATIEPSVSAYHLAFGTDSRLYVTGPTTSSFDHVYRISSDGVVSTFYRGLGRPQGLAFDIAGNLYVAASLYGRRGIIRLGPQGEAEWVVSGYNIVGLAFTPRRSMIVANHNSLFELLLEIKGKPLPS